MVSSSTAYSRSNEPTKDAPPGTPGRLSIERFVAELDAVRPPAAHLLDAEAKPRRGVDDDLLHQGVEVRRDARENRRRHLGAVGIAMQLLIRRLVDARARRLRGGDQPLDLRVGQPLVRIERDRLQRALDVRELRLDSGHRLAEQPESFEQPHHVGTDARRRTKVDDLDRDSPADAIQPADALLDRRGPPRQVVEHQPMAELEVAPLAARFSGHQEARSIVGPEPRDLGVAPYRGQLLVEDRRWPAALAR